MPDHLKALVVILVLAAAVFAFAKAPACEVATTNSDFVRRRNLWFGVTLAAFLAHSFWIYILAVGVLVYLAQRRESNKLAFYFLLLFTVPPIQAELNLGVPLFDMHYYRLLSLVVLLPALVVLRKQPDTEPFGRSLADKLLVGYVALQFVLLLQVNTWTNSIRQGVVAPFIDVILPYYVASRCVKDLQRFRDALMAFAVAAMVLSLIGGFEFVRKWLLYSELDNALGLRWIHGSYERRGGDLRAVAAIGQPIPLGYTIAVAMGFFVYLRILVPTIAWRFGIFLLIAGIISPLSRGPWMGVAVMLLVFLAIGPSPMLRLTKLGLVGAVILPPLLLSPMGDKIIDRLPFVGTIESENVTYRKQLLETSIALIERNPFFGSYDYIATPEMESLKQGQGIIDLVNTYAVVGLNSGLVGLSLFVGFFAAILFAILKSLRGLTDKNSEMFLLGQSLFSTLVGILVIIATVSPISDIAIVYWSVAGLGVGYARMVARAGSPAGAEWDAFHGSGAKIGSPLKSPARRA